MLSSNKACLHIASRTKCISAESERVLDACQFKVDDDRQIEAQLIGRRQHNVILRSPMRIRSNCRISTKPPVGDIRHGRNVS